MKKQAPDPREPEYAALDHLFDTAKKLGSGNASHGDVRAAALRYAAEVVDRWESSDLVPEFIDALVADLKKKARDAVKAR